MEQFIDDVLTPKGGLGFFQRNNPVVRHVVLRKRATLENMGLIPRLPVDIHPLPRQPLAPMFDGLEEARFCAADLPSIRK